MRKGEPIVVVKYVSKSYGKVEALKEVSLVVEQGEIFLSDKIAHNNLMILL